MIVTFAIIITIKKKKEKWRGYVTSNTTTGRENSPWLATGYYYYYYYFHRWAAKLKMWSTSRLEAENSCRAARVAPCALDPRSFLSHSFRPALAPPRFPNRFIRKYTSAKFQGTRVTREIRDRVLAVVSRFTCSILHKAPALCPSRSHNIFQHSNGCASDTIRSRNSKCARGAWLWTKQEMSQVTDGQVKKKKEKGIH